MEIEKKFLIKDIPDNLDKYPKKEIEQGYLSIKDPVLRVRRSNDDYILTYKSRLGTPQASQGKNASKEKKTDVEASKVALISNEKELPISKATYYHLLDKADYNLINKTRYLIPLENNLTAELDVFYGKLQGLIFAEVEFLDHESAINFIAPPWFGADVTFDKRFRNNYLIKINNLEELNL